MDQAAQLSELVSDIYDAALDPSLWSDVLSRAGRFVGGSAAAIFAKSPTAGSGNVYYESGTDPYYRQLYFDKYVKLDPSTTGHYFADVGHPIAIADLMPYCDFLDTRFYREWAQPQGMVDFVSAVLDKSVTSTALFGVFRHERDGIVDDETRRRMRLLVPHVRRAVLIGRLIDLKSAEAATFADTLDGLSTGMCLVDAAGRIVHANVACHVMLDAGDFLTVTGGRLAARDSAIDQLLQKLFASTGAGDAAIGTQGIALPLRAQDGVRYVAHVLPLTSGARRVTGFGYAAAAAVFIRKAALEPPAAPEVIARAYRLTPTELRVLLAIVEVGGVPEVAAMLGVAETTVKTHLGRLFVKTGTGRQADLVKIVAGFATPLASQQASTAPRAVAPAPTSLHRG
ncbi:LuxR family transcriptional regulator [Bradyrhizobium sp. KBS0727]|uniref:helix-turn-helix transcriptional regulator n=1 Tax=unclassified Bradyrhizobium TaxID=2631580 RepID=UPI00110DE765|nr:MULTISPECIES: helix-turn-helix transcriptional regulator [unclassified Bradyrhizobium]QDW40250.1 LuxR family transcriptional regulator [Bradyrhizobium sp. KBS0725]QDW46853.1 LuxR family transcriptional regulator [Bradyrhizobium sp. KBS0727]